MNKSNLLLKIVAAVAFAAMIAVNFLANALPIGGVTTGEASDAYANLFTPAGIIFAIWGLIYGLLFVYIIYQFDIGQTGINPQREKLFATINGYFLITSVANIAWIFSWHYGIIWLSVLIMLTLLVFLIKIADVVRSQMFSLTETLAIRAPFSIYFGWITVATIANITVLLVSLGWNAFGITEAMWTVVILLVGAGIGILRMWKDQNIFYGTVLVWAYSGIWLKHTSASGFNGAYPNIITTVIVCIALFLGMIGYLGYKKTSLNTIFTKMKQL